MNTLKNIGLLVLTALLLFNSNASEAQQKWDKDSKKVILITGTASGMGKATAGKLISEGHIVYGGDIQYEKKQISK